MTTNSALENKFSATGSAAANDPFSFDASDFAIVIPNLWAVEATRLAAAHVPAASHTPATVSSSFLDTLFGTSSTSSTSSSTTTAATTSSASPNLGTTNGLTNVLYPTNSDGSVDIRITDINQGTALGDCYFLASLGEIAIQHAFGIQDMIKVNADGTETVTLYEASSGSAVTWGTTSFKAVTITVNNSDFEAGAVNGQSGQATWNNEQVIWPQVLEYAFAQLTGGYSSIANGGSPVLAMEALTGRAATYYAPANVTATMLSNDWAAGDLIVFDTPEYSNSTDTNATYSLYGEHAYIFDGLTTTNGVTYVNLLNPWGYDNPSPIAISQLSSVFDEIDVGSWAAPTTPPAISGQASSVATSDEATATPFSGVTVTSIAGATETVTVKLSNAANGALSDVDGGTYNASTGTWTFSGTAAAATTALDALVFTPTAHQVAPGSTETTTLSLTVIDTNGSATASTSVVATATTDALTISGNATTGTDTDTATIKPFSGVSVAEPDAGQTFTATVTLSAAANGALSDVDGGTYNASTGVWTYSTTSLASLDAAIDALVFTPTAHQVTPGSTVATTLTLKVSDTAGSSASVADKITTTASNQAMTVSNTAAGTTKISDETTATPFKAVTISDPDYGRTVSATVTLSNASEGSLASSLGGTYNATFGIWTISGTAAAVQAAIDALVFTPTAHAYTPGTVTNYSLSLGISDNAGTTASGSATVAVTSATDAPNLSGFSTSVSATDTTTAKPFSSLTISEPDHGQTITATVTLSSTANGALSNLGSGTLSNGVYTVSGTAAAVTSALDALVFTPTAHQAVNGATVQTNLVLKVTDTAGATSSATTTISTKETELTVASGATSTITTTQTDAEVLNNGVIDLKAGTLTVSSMIDAGSTGTFKLDGSATLDVAAIQGSSSTMSFIGSSNELKIENASLFGTHAGTTAYTGPSLSGFASGDKIDLANISSSGASLSYNSSTGLLQVMHGTTDVASLSFAKTTLGTGSFHIASDGASGVFITLS